MLVPLAYLVKVIPAWLRLRLSISSVERSSLIACLELEGWLASLKILEFWLWLWLAGVELAVLVLGLSYTAVVAHLHVRLSLATTSHGLNDLRAYLANSSGRGPDRVASSRTRLACLAHSCIRPRRDLLACRSRRGPNRLACRLARR